MGRSRVSLFLALIPAIFALAQEEPRPRAPVPRVLERVLPAEYFDLPRVEREQKPAPPPSVTVWLRRGRASACARTRFSGERPEAVLLPLPGADSNGRKLRLIQLAWDPSRQTRYLAYDGGEALRGTLEAGPSTGERFALPEGWELRVEPSEESGCPILRGAPPIGRVESAGKTGPNAGALLARVELRKAGESGPPEPVWGWCLAEGRGGSSVVTATRSPGAGATQEWSLATYVPEDGGSVALVLAMSAVWRDPRDAREYRYLQFGPGGFMPLTEAGTAKRLLSAGPAVPHAVDLALFSEAEWPTCQSRASESGRLRPR